MANLKINKKTQLQQLNIEDITGLQSALDEKQVKANLSTNIDTDTDSDVKYPSVKAVETYVENVATGLESDFAELEDIVTNESTGLVKKVADNTAAISTINTELAKKLDKNEEITGGTFTKVTVDKNGLVTAGTTLAESDLPALSIEKITGLKDALDALEEEDTSLDGKISALTTTVEELDDAKLDKDFVDTVITDVTWSQTTSAITTVVTKHDIEGNTSTPTTVTLQEASSTQLGLMPAASFRQIVANTAAIEALENVQSIFPATGLADPKNITATALNGVIQTAANRTPNNGDTVDDLTHGATYRYYTNDTTGIDGSGWHEISYNTALATNSAPGIVQGSATDGKIFVENDGTMSVNGWDDVTDGIEDIEATLETKQDKLTAGTGIDITSNTISAVVMTGATESAGGTVGLVPASTTGDAQRFLRVDGTWQVVAQPTRYEMDLSSQLDGQKLSFTLTEALGTDFDVFYNGQRLKNNKNYTVSGTTLTLTLSYAPEAGEDLDIVYRK